MDVEEKLYRTAAEMGIACISISQRLALTEFHAQVRITPVSLFVSFVALWKTIIHEDMLGAT